MTPLALECVRLLRNAMVEAEDSIAADKAVGVVICGTAFDCLDPRSKLRVLTWLSGFEEGYFAARGWRDNDRQFRLDGAALGEG
jgi:hypothetical protein